jgi:hypothetical protein
MAIVRTPMARLVVGQPRGATAIAFITAMAEEKKKKKKNAWARQTGERERDGRGREGEAGEWRRAAVAVADTEWEACGGWSWS